MLKVTNRTWKEAEHRTRVQKGESSCPAAARRHEVRMKDLLSWLGRKGRYSRGQILGPLMLRSAHPHMLLSFASKDVSAANLELFGKSNVSVP